MKRGTATKLPYNKLGLGNIDDNVVILVSWLRIRATLHKIYCKISLIFFLLSCYFNESS